MRRLRRRIFVSLSLDGERDPDSLLASTDMPGVRSGKQLAAGRQISRVKRRIRRIKQGYVLVFANLICCVRFIYQRHFIISRHELFPRFCIQYGVVE